MFAAPHKFLKPYGKFFLVNNWHARYDISRVFQLAYHLPLNFISNSLILPLCNLNNSTEVADNFQVRPMYKTKSLLHPLSKLATRDHTDWHAASPIYGNWSQYIAVLQSWPHDAAKFHSSSNGHPFAIAAMDFISFSSAQPKVKNFKPSGKTCTYCCTAPPLTHHFIQETFKYSTPPPPPPPLTIPIMPFGSSLQESASIWVEVGENPPSPEPFTPLQWDTLNCLQLTARLIRVLPESETSEQYERWMCFKAEHPLAKVVTKHR